MKALTIKQPFASLLFYGKDVENRTWKTNFRGKVIIHAAATFYKARKMFISDWLTKEQIEMVPIDLRYEIMHRRLPLSAIIGEVEIVDCIQNHPSIWAIKGQWHWVLANPVLFHHIIPNVKGKLMLWDVDEGCQELIIDQYFRTGQ